MPHLSIETYVTQYFWLVVILFGFYYIAVTQIIPKFSETFKTRRKIENLAVESKDSEESTTSKQTTALLSNSISSSKPSNISSDNFSFKYNSHFVNSNIAWIKKTLTS